MLSPFEHRSFELADNGHDLRAPDRPGDPQLHLQPHHPVGQGQPGFVKKNVNFKMGETDIGFGLRPPTRWKDAKFNSYPGADGKPRTTRTTPPDHFDDFKVRLGYTLDYTAKLSGVPKDRLKLAELYADPKKKVVSFWTMGFNQHTRGTWVEQHDLQRPCWWARSPPRAPARSPSPASPRPAAPPVVGTFAHRLPADMVVTNPEHRHLTEEIWQLPEGTIRQDRLPRRGPEPRPEGRQAQVLLDQHHQQHAGRPQRPGDLPGLAQPAAFVVVSDRIRPSRPRPT